MWLMLYAFEFMLNHTSFDLFMMWLMFYAFECISCKASMITLILFRLQTITCKIVSICVCCHFYCIGLAIN